MRNEWSVDSWREYPVTQQPEWRNQAQLEKVIKTLKELPSLVFSGETRYLKKQLAEVNQNKAFVLQVGNCAESFEDCHGPLIHNFLRIMLQISAVLEQKTGKKIVKIGRIAGQYAKPRTSPTETIDGIEYPSYRGDNVNVFDLNMDSRIPNPDRLLEGYFRSAATLNLIRGFLQGGYSDITNIGDWERHFFLKESLNIPEYLEFRNAIDSLLKGGNAHLNKSGVAEQIFTSHEGLLLCYEEAFTRLDTVRRGYFDTSAHFIWVGDRTRSSLGAHIEYISGIGNPIGIKIGPNFEREDLKEAIHKANKQNEPGKLSLICRFGAAKISKKLPDLIRLVKDNDFKVVWICDPMHGNTYTDNGYKVRAMDDILDEIYKFIHICISYEVVPGGVHLELTAENVTECIGGICALSQADIPHNYRSKVDPRLNAAQSLEVALKIGEML